MMTSNEALSIDGFATENVEGPADSVEGLGTDEDASWDDYPIDTLLIRNETRTVHGILRRIEKGSFVMIPDFQRDFIWPEGKQSRLIESVLMRIPLPVFYLAEDDVGRLVVVDGLQRLTTFKRFVDGELRLSLPETSPLHGKRFNDLSPKHQNRVEDCNLILYIVDSKAPERARLDIFERVNSGEPLTRQQMRNCLYNGPGTRFLKQVAETELFKQATGASLNPKTMRDREMINRFASFYLLGSENYGGDMDEFLAKGLRELNRFDADRFSRLHEAFDTSLRHNLAIFGRHAFRKPPRTANRRSVFNASLWDVLSTGLADLPEERIRDREQALLDAFGNLLGQEDFEKAITIGTSQKSRVQDRFRLGHAMLSEVLAC